MHPIDFSSIIGNEAVKRQLECMLAKRAIGHALCFAGPDGIGKSLFAWALSARILAEADKGKDHAHKIQCGQHPDIHVYRPEGKLGLHSIQSMRQLSEEVYLPPFQSSWKSFIVHDADRMLSTSSNALLKTFEEPPPKTVIILLSRSKAALIPTIVSRCSTIHFQALQPEEIEEFLKQRAQLDDSTRARIAVQAKGSIGRAARLIEQGEEVRVRLLNLLAQGPLGNYKALKAEVQMISEHAEEAKKHAEAAAQAALGEIQADQLTAAQRASMEKELEGMAALAMTQEAQAIFEIVLSWYRDLQIFLLGGSLSLLTNPDYADALEQAVQRGESIPLVRVQEAVDKAYLSLQRSTSLDICLETLLLKLNIFSKYQKIS